MNWQWKETANGTGIASGHALPPRLECQHIRVMDNATHVAVYFGSYLKKPPVPMSRQEHYAGQDEIGLRYNSHRTKREEYLLMSGDEFMERFS